MQPTHQLPMVTTPAEVLTRSADYLAAHGWVRNAMYDLCDDSRTPAACTVGAIRVAVFGRPIYNDLDFDDYQPGEPIKALADLVITTEHVLIQLLPDKPETHPECSAMDRIAVWNDWPGRTAQDVIRALILAAADLLNSDRPAAKEMAVAR
jgi:hypothetical protein